MYVYEIQYIYDVCIKAFRSGILIFMQIFLE